MTSPGERAAHLLDEADIAATVGAVTRIDGGRGVFSLVERAEVRYPSGAHGSLALKHGLADTNGAAAIASGAYAREALAYEHVLPATPAVLRPACHAVVHHASHGHVGDRSGPISFVLEDLSPLRTVDQLDGLTPPDVAAVVIELIELHRAWADEQRLELLDVRRSTPAHLDPAGLARGLEAIDERWGDAVSAEQRDAFRALVVNRDEAVEAFLHEDAPTLCHGDPRADNVFFRDDGRAVLFDWQQLAVQFGEADLAWLLATSTTPTVRRAAEADVVASYALARGQEAGATWRRYRTGMVLPGLAVLFLAQREANLPRTEKMIATSLQRIGTALLDLDVVGLVTT